MSMATATLGHLDTENTTTGLTSKKENIPTETLTPASEATASNTDSGTTGAAEGDIADDDRSIQFVTSEPDTATNATEMTTNTTEEPPFEGDGADPAQAPALIPPRSTFDWLAYTVSLNYNRLATSVFSPITRWNWYDPVPHTNIVLGAVPSHHLLIQLQRDHAIQNIVNMCAEFKGHLQTMKELGLVQCWLPTQDFSTPSVESIWTGVKFIEKCEKGWRDAPEEKRGALYVHCKAGRGRSATVVLCWLVYCYKLTVVEAQVILLKARGQVDKNVYLHPEVVSFYEQVQEQENNGVLERKVWPGNNSHSQVDNSGGGDNSSCGAGGGGGGTGEGSGGTSGDA
ncbi:MAG: protein-tyrosine phosphatase-like protein [Linnemannia elongata]|nr:MAG: protein-tyrosine phosphatase-like protein [Linnemannia elongata]